MAYKPNFSDPRTQRRLKQALGFVQGTMSATTPRAWSTRYIDRYLGGQSNPLSRWLRERLLIETDNTYRFGTDAKCKEYRLNTRWAEYLKKQLSTPTSLDDLVIDWASEGFEQELRTKTFTYRDQSSRLWHPLQNVRKQYRRRLFADSGFNWEYDIQAAAPTIIYQAARAAGLTRPLVALESYLSDRQATRQRIAREAEITESDAKTILTALFSGAPLGNIPDSQLYQLLDGDLARIIFLQEHKFIQELKSDIRHCWQQLKKTQQVKPVEIIDTATGEIKKKAIRSREKWRFYFQEERRVIDVVQEVLAQAGVKFFLEHDGWSTDLPIDESLLLAEIKSRTGYDLRVDCKPLCKMSAGVTDTHPRNLPITSDIIETTHKNTTPTTTPYCNTSLKGLEMTPEFTLEQQNLLELLTRNIYLPDGRVSPKQERTYYQTRKLGLTLIKNYGKTWEMDDYLKQQWAKYQKHIDRGNNPDDFRLGWPMVLDALREDWYNMGLLSELPAKIYKVETLKTMKRKPVTLADVEWSDM